ncbi:kinase-like protein [Bimuria novae-zelandiae CBS 107.79]|uniref:Kinase-like protein n=1 Tax=Bimuria novae-zelandiae CBS 107.79 TaxID=1447943 RepID=A0A6A5USN8_9PLEO|nr:kinase-like protein [Bimuria novae-zelandiae CBS 107.79]
MAPISGSSHSFQKLRIDTSTPSKPAPSTFASIPRDDPQHGFAESQQAAGLAEAEGQHPVQAIPIRRSGQNSHAHYVDTPVAITSSSDSEGDDIEAQFRQRGKSISFNDQVTLDSGNRHAIDVPLPRSNAPPHSFDSDGSTEQDYLQMQMRQPRRLQRQPNTLRYPLLQTTVDEMAADPECIDNVASLTSEATASPPDEVRTPQDAPSEFLLSPLPVSSAVEFPQMPQPKQRISPPRSKSYHVGENDSILRRGSRRTSTRTGRSLSSMSPAASFLAGYKSQHPLKAPEPDDEGQGIGYDGEYIIGKQIGWGGFSLVKEVMTIVNGTRETHAVKIVRKQVQDKSELENDQIQTQFDHEVEIWRFLRHPYILPLMRVYTTDFATFCITKLNKGGTLFDLVRDLRKNKKNGLPQNLAKRYTYQIASAMRYLHNDVQVVHRDIKLENCLVDMTGPQAETEGGDVLLCDFGMADFIVSDQRDSPEPQSIGTNDNIGPSGTSTCIAGSLQYAAPELFTAGVPIFSPAADVWAFGVVVYALLTASLPFNEGLDARTAAKIQKGEYDLDAVRNAEALQEGDAEDAIALVKGCLELDPEKRWTVHDILECHWLAGCSKLYEVVSRPWIADS